MTASRLNSSAAAASSRSCSVRGPTKGARDPVHTSTHARAIRAGGTPTQQVHTPPATSGTRELLLRESGSLDFGNRLHPDAAGPCQNSDEHAASLPERDLANAVGRYVLPTPTAPRTSLQWPASAKRNETRSDNAPRSAGRRVRFRCRSACSNSTRPSPNVLVPNAIRGVTLRRPNSSRKASWLSWCCRASASRCGRMSFGERSLRALRSRSINISFPHSIIEHPSTGLIPVLRPPS